MSEQVDLSKVTLISLVMNLLRHNTAMRAAYLQALNAERELGEQIAELDGTISKYEGIRAEQQKKLEELLGPQAAALLKQIENNPQLKEWLAFLGHQFGDKLADTPVPQINQALAERFGPDITFKGDVRNALKAAWEAAGLPTGEGSVWLTPSVYGQVLNALATYMHAQVHLDITMPKMDALRAEYDALVPPDIRDDLGLGSWLDDPAGKYEEELPADVMARFNEYNQRLTTNGSAVLLAPQGERRVTDDIYRSFA